MRASRLKRGQIIDFNGGHAVITSTRRIRKLPDVVLTLQAFGVPDSQAIMHTVIAPANHNYTLIKEEDAVAPQTVVEQDGMMLEMAIDAGKERLS